ncbi:diphthine--ammonia ligase [Pedobacter sp. P351]|uniref:Dph6-related ATP pyrophosphatase n=1 Tax=Pedobacter superstes TaxID=3133441 RepID=UPI0030B4D2EB
MMEKAIFCWSGGKDSSLCLYEVLKAGKFDVKYLLTTINGNVKRISMHGVQEELLLQQADSIGIELKKVYVYEGSNQEYEKNMEELLLQMKEEGINHVIFGDIFLEDLRKYREDNLAKVGMKAVFPLWKQDTITLIESFIDLGFKTITCCVNDYYLGEDMVGTEIDKEFVKNLPENVDPCGENGEFHTFCFDGPIFKIPIRFDRGEKLYKPLEINGNAVCSSLSGTKGFWYCDLLPAV